jgi:hypothetical protein
MQVRAPRDGPCEPAAGALFAVADATHLVGGIAAALVRTAAKGISFLAGRPGGRLVDGDGLPAHSSRVELFLVRRGVARLTQLPSELLRARITPAGRAAARDAAAPQENAADRSRRESGRERESSSHYRHSSTRIARKATRPPRYTRPTSCLVGSSSSRAAPRDEAARPREGGSGA